MKDFLYAIWSYFLVIFRQYKTFDFFFWLFKFFFRKQIWTFTFTEKFFIHYCTSLVGISDMWQVTGDTRKVTCSTWLKTCDTWHLVNYNIFFVLVLLSEIHFTSLLGFFSVTGSYREYNWNNKILGIVGSLYSKEEKYIFSRFCLLMLKKEEKTFFANML